MKTITGGDVIDPQVKALMASGSVIRNGFYNNLSATDQGAMFKSGVATASNYSGIGRLVSGVASSIGSISSSSTGLKRDIPYNDNIVNELNSLARDISNLGKIPIDVARDFLYILISVDNITDMKKIADAVELPELANEAILNSPLDIFAVKNIVSVAFLADAVAGVVNMYAKYKNIVSQQQGNQTNYNSSLFELINQITGNIGVLSSLAGFAGAIGGTPNSTAASATNIMGNNLSKLITGKEIPIGIQTNNPSHSSPSVTGKMMFGEAPNSAALIDMKQLFAKPIAVFSEVNGGAGNMSFAMKNTGSLNTPQTLDDLITKVAFGGHTPTAGTFGADLLERMQSNAGSILNVGGTSMVEMNRADNAIPIMSALSDVLSGVTDKLPNINKEMRAQVTKITETEDGISNLHKKGVDLEEAQRNGLNTTSVETSPLPINIDIKSVFPIDVFSQGWSDMNNSMQHLQKNSTDFNKLLTVLQRLG